MSFSIYTMPGLPALETEREVAVERSGALGAFRSEVLDAITAEACRKLRTAIAMVNIIYQESSFVIAASGFMPGIYRRSTSFCAHAILVPQEPFVIPDMVADERFAGNPYVDEENGMRFYAGVALADDRRMPLGALCVLDPVPRASLTRPEVEYLQRLSTGVMEHLRERVV